MRGVSYEDHPAPRRPGITAHCAQEADRIPTHLRHHGVEASNKRRCGAVVLLTEVRASGSVRQGCKRVIVTLHFHVDRPCERAVDVWQGHEEMISTRPDVKSPDPWASLATVRPRCTKIIFTWVRKEHFLVTLSKQVLFKICQSSMAHSIPNARTSSITGNHRTGGIHLNALLLSRSIGVFTRKVESATHSLIATKIGGL
mmetsp:Transcript_139835/g.257469  ORF Transcript_139835/g.257469 Transcript_139835/m.257469 type:complete len:200 (+) Transcript_139835:626-1225(+)